MPLIRIDYDDDKVTKEDIERLSVAIQKIIIKETDIKEVFVYANTAQIKIGIDPIEIFIEMSAHIAEGKPDLMKSTKEALKDWKKENNFSFPINMTIIPMDWQLEIGI